MTGKGSSAASDVYKSKAFDFFCTLDERILAFLVHLIARMKTFFEKIVDALQLFQIVPGVFKAVLASPNSTFTSSIFTSTSSGPVYP